MLYIGNTRYKVANKPYDAEVEYLQVSGNGYRIFTGQKMKSGGGFGCTISDYSCALPTTGSGYPFLLGTEYSNQRACLYTKGTNSTGAGDAGKLNVDWQNSYAATTIVLAGSNKQNIEIKQVNSTTAGIFLNNVRNTTKTYFTFPDTDNSVVRMFNPNQFFYCKIYNIVVYDSNNTLSFDGIPVRVGDKGYIYDKVNGKLHGNSGTGTFTLGPDKYDSEVQYIESTGTQYINTGIGFKKALSTRIQFCLTKLNSNNQLLYGAWADNSSYPKTQFLTNSSNVFAPVYETEYVSAKLTDTGSTINGTAAYSNKFYDVTVLSPAQSASTLNCYLFARDNDVNNYLPYNGLRLYACKMTQDGVVVRDFIPVRKNGVGYLYDKISDQLFGNIGTGNFIIGPDINIRARRIVTNSVIIQPYISDGLVFHLDGSDFDSQNMKWTDKIGNIVFNMYNVSLYNGKGVKFNGNTNSYGRSSTIVNYSYTTSTIEIVQYRYAQSGFVFDPANASAIRYIQGGSYVNFTYGAASKRSGISTQSLNKISTHSINMDRDVFNGTSYNFVSNDTWSASSSNTYLGIRNGASYPLNGIIYQIRIYNRKLSLQEILYNQEQDKKRYGIIF